MVAVATLKKDGMFFLGGVLIGLFAFGEAVPTFWRWYVSSGAAGRFTLGEWLSADPGLIVLIIVVVALACYVVVERVERLLAARGKEVR